MKVCNTCGEEKALTEFNRNRRYKDQKERHCKQCERIKGRRWRNKPEIKERYKKKRADWNKDIHNRAKLLLWSAKYRANRNNLEFNISEDDLLPLPTHCPVLGLKLSTRCSAQADNAYSLDRINPKKGYVKGNVVVISNRANILKRDATLTELRLLYEFYKDKGA